MYTCYVLWGLGVLVSFSGVWVYLFRSLGFVCTCFVLWGLGGLVSISGVCVDLLCNCSLGPQYVGFVSMHLCTARYVGFVGVLPAA